MNVTTLKKKLAKPMEYYKKLRSKRTLVRKSTPKELKEYFRDSRMREKSSSIFAPFIVLEEEGIRVLKDPRELLAYKGNTQVLGMWKRSNKMYIYKFTVRDLKAHCIEHPKQSWEII